MASETVGHTAGMSWVADDGDGGYWSVFDEETGDELARIFCCAGTVKDHEERARLIVAAPDYAAAVEQMLAHEQGGGDGWWKGFYMLKTAHARATGAEVK